MDKMLIERCIKVKLKEKIIGALSILILSIIFLVAGYIINHNKEEEYKEVFLDEQQYFQSQNSKGNGENENTENKDSNKDSNKKDSENQENINDNKIVVDIKGAVKAPKEYELKAGSRVRDLIEIAGGLTPEADEEKIYFSKILEDEQCIKIYKIGEEVLDSEIEVEEQQEKDTGAVDSKGKININKATVDELMTIPGIGQVKAQSIVDYRNENGKFNSVDELTNITGIGVKTLEKLRDKVDIK
ncbi:MULTISPECIES: helix-hairpin-helix domain-containing protein [unclassified Clostridium]|uniref:helix-hairpin-helix domain-containing protein n=1 Tax=unclassified Clostridium TaxID=2614128 RepID=UPI000E90949C|nr:competence protein ComE [Clostridium sp.]